MLSWQFVMIEAFIDVSMFMIEQKIGFKQFILGDFNLHITRNSKWQFF